MKELNTKNKIIAIILAIIIIIGMAIKSLTKGKGFLKLLVKKYKKMPRHKDTSAFLLPDAAITNTHTIFHAKVHTAIFFDRIRYKLIITANDAHIPKVFEFRNSLDRRDDSSIVCTK